MPTGSNVDIGTSLVTTGYSASGGGVDLIPPTDVSNYKWLSVYIGADSYSGTINFQGSFDGGSTWLDITLYRLGNLDGAHSVSSILSETSTLFGAPVRFPLFRCRMISWTSGTATATLELRSEGMAGLSLTGTNQAAGILSGQYIIGATVNDGVWNVAIPAGTSSDTVVYTGTKCVLGSVLVTATGTHQMTFYDNAASPSGVIVGLIPANPTVNGITYVFKSFCANGIVIAGDSNNPGVTVFYSDIYS